MARLRDRTDTMTTSRLLWMRCFRRRRDMISRMKGGRVIATASQMRDMLRAAWTCPLCSCVLTLDANQPTSAEFDHHPVALKHGGDHAVENMRVICRSCHAAEDSNGSADSPDRKSCRDD